MAGLDPAISSHVAKLQSLPKNRRMREAWVYMMTNRMMTNRMMTNRCGGVLYLGVTNNMARRAWEHREGVIAGFTSRYQLKRLVWVERHATMPLAIQREKNIKHWPRAWKIALIETTNPEWCDLYGQVL
jgi:putative endonuclease